MANEREASTQLATFFKFVAVGQSVAGYIYKTGKNDQGEHLTFQPALVRNSFGEKYVKQDAVAVGLSTDMAMKIDTRKDLNKFMVIEFVDTEATKRGQPKKIFRVVELTQPEIVGLRDGTFQLPALPPREAKVAAASGDLF